MNTTTHEERSGRVRSQREDSPRRDREERRRKSALQNPGRLGCNPDLLDFSRFVYRWMNDKPGRMITKTKHDDWDMVPQSGEKEDSTDLGDMVSVVVGTRPDGSPLRAYLCRKPKTFYDEDKAAEQVELEKQEQLLRIGRSRNGEAQSDYVPHSGIRM